MLITLITNPEGNHQPWPDSRQTSTNRGSAFDFQHVTYNARIFSDMANIHFAITRRIDKLYDDPAFELPEQFFQTLAMQAGSINLLVKSLDIRSNNVKWIGFPRIPEITGNSLTYYQKAIDRFSDWVHYGSPPRSELEIRTQLNVLVHNLTELNKIACDYRMVERYLRLGQKRIMADWKAMKEWRAPTPKIRFSRKPTVDDVRPGDITLMLPPNAPNPTVAQLLDLERPVRVRDTIFEARYANWPEKLDFEECERVELLMKRWENYNAGNYQERKVFNSPPGYGSLRKTKNGGRNVGAMLPPPPGLGTYRRKKSEDNILANQGATIKAICQPENDDVVTTDDSETESKPQEEKRTEPEKKDEKENKKRKKNKGKKKKGKKNKANNGQGNENNAQPVATQEANKTDDESSDAVIHLEDADSSPEVKKRRPISIISLESLDSDPELESPPASPSANNYIIFDDADDSDSLAGTYVYMGTYKVRRAPNDNRKALHPVANIPDDMNVHKDQPLDSQTVGHNSTKEVLMPMDIPSIAPEETAITMHYTELDHDNSKSTKLFDKSDSTVIPCIEPPEKVEELHTMCKPDNPAINIEQKTDSPGLASDDSQMPNVNDDSKDLNPDNPGRHNSNPPPTVLPGQTCENGNHDESATTSPEAERKSNSGSPTPAAEVVDFNWKAEKVEHTLTDAELEIWNRACVEEETGSVNDHRKVGITGGIQDKLIGHDDRAADTTAGEMEESKTVAGPEQDELKEAATAEG